MFFFFFFPICFGCSIKPRTCLELRFYAEFDLACYNGKLYGWLWWFPISFNVSAWFLCVWLLLSCICVLIASVDGLGYISCLLLRGDSVFMNCFLVFCWLFSFVESSLLYSLMPEYLFPESWVDFYCSGLSAFLYELLIRERLSPSLLTFMSSFFSFSVLSSISWTSTAFSGSFLDFSRSWLVSPAAGLVELKEAFTIWDVVRLFDPGAG